MSGYDIKRFLEDTVAHFWSESYGQIYPTLRALEAQGLVSGRAEAAGRSRRVYRLTDLGLRELRTWLAEPPEPHVPRYEISLKLFFGDQLTVDEARGHLRSYRHVHVDQLDRYRTHEAELRESMRGAARLPYWLAVIRGGIRYAEMVVAWCDETLAALETLDPNEYPASPTASVATAGDADAAGSGDGGDDGGSP